MNKRYILFFVVACLISCNVDKKEQLEMMTLNNFGDEIYLEAESLTLEDSILKPYQIELMDSLLFILNRNSMKLLQVYNLNVGKMIYEGIFIGNGPDEVNSAILCPTYNKNNFCLLEKSKNEIWIYKMNDLDNEKGLIPSSRIKLEDQSTLAEIMSSNRIVSDDLYDPLKKFKFYNMNGKCIEMGGSYIEWDKGLSLQENKMKDLFRFVTNKKDRIFVGHLLTDVVEVYNQKGSLIRRIQGPDNFKSVVEERKSGQYSSVVPMRDSKDAYITPRDAGEEVFVQYLGMASGPQTPAIYKKLFVFNWDGKPLRRYRLSENTPFFDVDPVKRIIYGVAKNPEYHLVMYRY